MEATKVQTLEKEEKQPVRWRRTAKTFRPSAPGTWMGKEGGKILKETLESIST